MDHGLTKLEIETLKLLYLPNKHLAREFCVEKVSIEARIKNILLKLGAENRTQAVLIGLVQGIIDIPIYFSSGIYARSSKEPLPEGFMSGRTEKVVSKTVC